MRILSTAYTALAFVAGLIALGYAFIYPSGFQLATASAIQIQQVYSQATFYAVLGLGAFASAGVAGLSLVIESISDLKGGTRPSAAPNTGAPQSMGGKLGSL